MSDKSRRKQGVKDVFQRALNWSSVFGLDVRKALTAIRGLPLYVNELHRFRGQIHDPSSDRFTFLINPQFEDRSSESGMTKSHYFHQDLLVASRIFHHNPDVHVDVGSRIDGFIAHLAVFREVEIFDI